jgi:16S rRNA (cytosine1402-N4)-methyltransferase
MQEQTIAVKKIHRPVLLKRTLLEAANLPKNAKQMILIDGTMGDGGHSHAIFESFIKKSHDNYLISIDWDRKNYEFIRNFFPDYPEELKLTSREKKETRRWLYVQSNFAKLEEIVHSLAFQNDFKDYGVGFVLLDLGISSRQLANRERGFSFTNYSKLDMRMDPDTYSVTAYDLLNMLSINKLTDMFIKTVGIHKSTARELAKAIVAARENRPFGASDDIKRLNIIAEKVQPIRKSSVGKLHPSTLLFLALRIAVNTELQNLVDVLGASIRVVAKGGKILAMTYHSAEERIVQDFIKRFNLQVKKYLPSKNEIKGNPRARSAKLFVITV